MFCLKHAIMTLKTVNKEILEWRVIDEKKEKANRIIPDHVVGNHAYFSDGYAGQFCPEENC